MPILCAFPAACLADGSLKDLFDRVDTFLGTLKQAIASSGEDICVIASGELAHIGLRYGDQKPPTDFSFHRCMQTDLEMLKHVENLEPKPLQSLS